MTTTEDGCATSTRRDDALTRAGELALAEARRLFDLDVIDPPIGAKGPQAELSLEVINEIMAATGWRPAGGYKGNGPPQWCIMFDAYCWLKAGLALDVKRVAAFFGSTMRVHYWATYRAWNEHPNPKPADATDLRLCGELAPGKPVPFEPRAGDILIVGDGSPKDGDHGTIIVSYDPERRAFLTISGNGGGVGPHGDKRDARGGISLAEYFIDSGHYRAMLEIRPALQDLRV